MDKMDTPTNNLAIRELSKEPKKSGSGQFGDDASKLLFELNPSQRNTLLLRYADQGESFQKALDEVLHKFVLQEHLPLLKYKSEIEIESQSQNSFLFTNKGAIKSVEQKIANQSMLLEYKKFWVDENARQIPQENSGKDYNKEPDEATMIRLKRLSAYVPKLVVRRLYNNPSPIQLPEIEYYQACVVFADVSGFTPLTEKMASMGPEGVEKLTGQLNKYFDMMISNIYRHGGDIVKFAGDAILVVWPASTKEGLAAVIQLACQCCHSLIEELNNYEVPGTGCTLRLHIGVGAGQAGGVHVGGVNKQCEFFISGQVLEQVSSCEKQALPGEVFVSAVAWMLVKKGILIGQQKGGGALANYRLEGIKVPIEQPPPVQLPLYAYMEDSFKTYIQQGVLRHIYSGTKKFIGELRTVSVVFVNLTSPFVESKLNELQESIKAMQEIIYKYEGTVRQFMIDDKGSVMIAGFGLPPFAHEDDPVRAVETAMSIFTKLQELRIACSIGVTTGRAFCGDVGSDQRKEYAMVGDIVNLSARLMAAAKTGVLTDHDTYEASKERIEFNKLEPIRVKGKSMPISVYVPVKRKTGTTTNLKTLTSSIIGRDKEVKIIQGVIRGLQDTPATSPEPARRNTMAPKVNMIIIEGEAGVGKSRLLHETAGIFKVNNLPVFHGHGDQLLNSLAYHGWQSVLETALNEKGEFIKPMKIDKDLLPLLNNVLRLNHPETQKVSLMSAQLKSETTQALLLQILKEIVPKNSLVILENAQWFDSGSWALTLAARQHLDGVLFMLAARTMKEKGRLPFQFSQLLHSSHTQHIVLQNLSENDTAQLMAHALHLKTVPEEVSREIYKRSQGNPFLTEEIIYALRDSGKIQLYKNGTMSIAPDFQSTVPAGLQGLITSKLDRMSPSQQIVLKVASTIGAAFDVNMLLNVMMSTGTETSRMPFVKIADLQKDLKATEASGFTSLSTEDKQDPENPTYTFTNSLIKDIIYGLMLFSQRRQLHGNVAHYYQETYPGKSTFYPILAYHHKQAEQNEEALDYYTKAGSSCLNTYSNKEAVTFFSEALQLTSKIRETPNVDDITMERKLGQAYYNLGVYDKAYTQFKQALDLMGLSVGDDDKKKSSNATIKKRITTHNFFKDEKNKKAEIDKSEIPHRTREAVISLLALTKVSFYTCNKPTALLCGALALQIAPSTGAALEGEANALACLTAAIDGEYQNAEAYITKGRELAGKQIDVSKSVEQFAGLYYCGRGQWEFAASALHKAITAAKTVGDLRTLEECQLHSATVLYLKGDIKKSTSSVQEALESATRRADSQTQVIANTALARNFYSLGDYSNCLTCLEDIRLVLESIGLTDVSTEINYYTLAALMNLRQRKFEQFLFFAETAYNILSRCEPTMFSNFFGYSCLAECWMKLFLEPSYLEEGRVPFSKAKLKEKVEKTLGFLQEFAKCFEFAEARSHLWQGVWKHYGGKQSKAKVLFAKALEVAKNSKMPYEEALILHQIGLVTKNDDEVKKALELYPELQFRTVDLVSVKPNEETK